MPTTTPSLAAALDSERGLRVARAQQNVLLGFLAGFMTALVCTAGWVALALASGLWFGWAAIAAALAVGLAVRFFGRGFDAIFGLLGVGGTLVSCALATVLIGSKQIAEHEHLTLWQALGAFQPHSAADLFRAGFGARDAAMFAAAAALAWFVARRQAPAGRR